MIEEKFVKTDEIVLFSSAQKYPRHIYDETKNRKGAPKRKTKEKPSKNSSFLFKRTTKQETGTGAPLE
jgi:hypothetical protein